MASNNSQGCVFKILPRYKVRSIGDEVRYNDQVKLESVKTEGQFLHCSSRHYKKVFSVLEHWYVHCKNKIVTLTQILCYIRCVVQALCDVFYYRLKVETCTYLQPISNNYIEIGVGQKSTEDDRGWAVSKKGWVRKMNIQQEVGSVKKGRIRNVNWDPTRKT